eukprot:sb/3464178/
MASTASTSYWTFPPIVTGGGGGWIPGGWTTGGWIPGVFTIKPPIWTTGPQPPAPPPVSTDWITGSGTPPVNTPAPPPVNTPGLPGPIVNTPGINIPGTLTPPVPTNTRPGPTITRPTGGPPGGLTTGVPGIPATPGLPSTPGSSGSGVPGTPGSGPVVPDPSFPHIVIGGLTTADGNRVDVTDGGLGVVTGDESGVIDVVVTGGRPGVITGGRPGVVTGVIGLSTDAVVTGDESSVVDLVTDNGGGVVTGVVTDVVTGVVTDSDGGAGVVTGGGEVITGQVTDGNDGSTAAPITEGAGGSVPGGSVPGSGSEPVTVGGPVTTEEPVVVTTELSTTPAVFTVGKPIFTSGEEEVFSASRASLTASFVFGGQYCQTSTEKSILKAAFLSWDTLFSGSCVSDGTCDVAQIHCQVVDSTCFEVSLKLKEYVEAVSWCYLFLKPLYSFFMKPRGFLKGTEISTPLMKSLHLFLAPSALVLLHRRRMNNTILPLL